MARQKSVNGSKKILKALNDLMKDLDKKVSIKVGIIGEQAYEKHPHTDLTMAHLGAIHEFGATIQVTDKMRAYLHHIGVHLKADTTTITIPARSFLRDTFFTGDAKERLMDFAGLGSREFNKEYFEMIEQELKCKLSDLESRVLHLHLLGEDYHSIAKLLDKSPKSIDNALQRIKNKMSGILRK